MLIFYRVQDFYFFISTIQHTRIFESGCRFMEPTNEIRYRLEINKHS